MPSFPQPGKVTIGEINRELVTADHLSDDRARETYGKVIGTVFGPVTFESDGISGTEAEQRDVLLQQRNLGKILQNVDLHAVSWHKQKHILAFIYGPHQSQKDVKFIEWRPNDGHLLWASSYPGNVASVRAVAMPSISSRSSNTRWTLVDILRSRDNEQISALEWSPNGRYLASAAFENSSFTIWDVEQAYGLDLANIVRHLEKEHPLIDFFSHVSLLKVMLLGLVSLCKCSCRAGRNCCWKC